MSMIFVNLPVRDLEQSKAFYVALGCTINPNFTDENAAAAAWSDDIYFMLLTHDFFATFTEKSLVDPTSSIQTIIALSCDSNADVDAKVEAGLMSGGSKARKPEDYGFMYQRSMHDPDGHLLEFTYMDPEAAAIGPEAYMEKHGDGQ